MNISVNGIAQLWTDRARQYVEALREPIHRLVERKQRLLTYHADKKVYNAFLYPNRDWDRFSQSYFSGVAMSGDALSSMASVGGAASIASGIGGPILWVGAGFAVAKGLRGFLSRIGAQNVIEKRVTTKTLTGTLDNKKFHHPGVLDYADAHIAPFRMDLRAAEEALRIIQVARNIKRLKEFYRSADAYPDEKVLDYTRYEDKMVGGFHVTLGNLCHHANKGLLALQSARTWLDKMPPSVLRDGLVQEFQTIAGQFKSETRMLPRKLENIADDHSIWSDIQKICSQVDALKTHNATPQQGHSLQTTQTLAPIPSGNPPPLRLASRRP